MVPAAEEIDSESESESDPEYAPTPAPPSASSEIPLPAPKRDREWPRGSTAPRSAPATPSRRLHNRRIYPFDYDKWHVPLVLMYSSSISALSDVQASVIVCTQILQRGEEL